MIVYKAWMHSKLPGDPMRTFRHLLLTVCTLLMLTACVHAPMAVEADRVAPEIPEQTPPKV